MREIDLGMDIKDILAKGLKDGVGEFFNSVTDQIHEQNKETFKMYYETLQEIDTLLEPIIEKNKSIKTVDDIYGIAYYVAMIVSEQDIESEEFLDIRKSLENNSLEDYFYDIRSRWTQTKAFLESDFFKSILRMNVLFNYLNEINITEECNSFFNNIITFIMSNDEKGLFAVKKTKKKITPYVKRICGMCVSYSLAINMSFEIE